MPGGGVGAQQDGFAIVGEFEAGPVGLARFDALLRHVGPDVEGGEGGFVVIPQVVEEDRVGGGGGDGDDGRGRVVSGEVRGQEVEARLRGLGFQVPEADGVVAGAGEEGVGGWAEGEGGDFVGVALEVAQELVVMGGEIADAVVDFGARVDDGGGVVGEAREMDPVLLREEFFDMPALFGIVQLDGVVVARGKHEFARVVEVQGRDRRFWLSEPEVLKMTRISRFRVLLAKEATNLRCSKLADHFRSLLGRWTLGTPWWRRRYRHWTSHCCGCSRFTEHDS